MARGPRNPRRAYDADRREIRPATLGYLRENGWRTVAASCRECQHSLVVYVDRLPDEFPVPDGALKLLCSAYGSKQITRSTCYQAMHKATGWSAGR